MRYINILILMLILSACAVGKNEKSQSENIFKTIRLSEMKEIMKKENPVILDVRTEDEYRSGHIANSININFYKSDFKKKIDELSREKIYIVYCRSGNRSYQTMKIMKNSGFKKVYNLSGGIGALKTAKYPLKY